MCVNFFIMLKTRKQMLAATQADAHALTKLTVMHCTHCATACADVMVRARTLTPQHGHTPGNLHAGAMVSCVSNFITIQLMWDECKYRVIPFGEKPGRARMLASLQLMRECRGMTVRISRHPTHILMKSQYLLWQWTPLVQFACGQLFV